MMSSSAVTSAAAMTTDVINRARRARVMGIGVNLRGGALAEVGPDERRVNDPNWLNANSGLGGANMYVYIHRARARIALARQALQLYAPDGPSTPKAWQGELYALEGYTVLWFAENFCSGIPLTDTKLVGVSEPSAGLTTQQMFQRAIALFDSAAVSGADSSRFVNLAKVGKGRALLDLGRFAAADSAVRGVPTDFVYVINFAASGNYANALAYDNPNYRVQDNEGGNGLVWSTDPRTAITTASSSGAMLRWSKYNVTPSGTLDPTYSSPTTPVRLADGLEARLIQSEAALAAGDPSWLTILNTLRHDCLGNAACAPVPGLTAANLPDTLTDPGSEVTRENLVFKERAMWLYATGHREGDLRRLAHVYSRNVNSLWPTGTIVAPAFPPLYDTPLPENGSQYGADVVFGPDLQEHVNNPLYAGCYDYNP